MRNDDGFGSIAAAGCVVFGYMWIRALRSGRTVGKGSILVERRTNPVQFCITMTIQLVLIGVLALIALGSWYPERFRWVPWSR